MKRIRAWGWVFVALVATIGAGGWLLVADLLWTVPMPWLVLTGILALTAAPGLVPALRRRGARWASVVTFLVACLVGIGVAAGIERLPCPRRRARRRARTGRRRPDSSGWLPALLRVGGTASAASGSPGDRDGRLGYGLPGGHCAGPACRVDLHKEHDDRCGAYLTRPAPFGRYGLTILARGPEAQNTARMTLDGEVRTGPYVWLLVTTDSSS